MTLRRLLGGPDTSRIGRPALPLHPPRATAREPVRACGWYDSSHDLRHGLLVQEHATPDAVAADLPLAAWVDLHLCGGGVTPPA